MIRKPEEIINELIKQYSSLREFARAIHEDASDVMRWRYGRARVTPRAVIKICELHPVYLAHELNPDIFPHNLALYFTEVSK